MMSEIKRDAERRMQKAADALQHEMIKIRTGRASANLLDHVMVDYYGNMTPINQVANVTASDARTISVTPWEKSMFPAVEKAILNSGLGLNPANSGSVIRVPMPPLSEERRKEMIRVVKSEAEQGRVAVRNIRRDANQALKESVKAKDISEDDERRSIDDIQKLTDQFIAQIDAILEAKEKDLMEI